MTAFVLREDRGDIEARSRSRPDQARPGKTRPRQKIPLCLDVVVWVSSCLVSAFGLFGPFRPTIDDVL
jgi:hypothetical protein